MKIHLTFTANYEKAYGTCVTFSRIFPTTIKPRKLFMNKIIQNGVPEITI